MIEIPFTAQRLLMLACFVPLTGIATGAIYDSKAYGQDTTQKESSDLTDGLLELLNEPKKNENETSPAGDRLPSVVPKNLPILNPADVGLEGENLDENSANPLESVRQSMFIAAGLLQRGATDASTQEVQTGIVQRLDELISQLEQKQASANKKASRQQRSERQTQNKQQESEQSKEQRANRQQQSSDSGELAETRPNPQNPGQSGVAPRIEVDLADPKALQQNVWGHLPERLRTQMQSRMVEQFLPSYREQIEAYFKALLEQQ